MVLNGRDSLPGASLAQRHHSPHDQTNASDNVKDDQILGCIEYPFRENSRKNTNQTDDKNCPSPFLHGSKLYHNDAGDVLLGEDEGLSRYWVSFILHPSRAPK